MKQCECGGRLTSYHSRKQGTSMVRYLHCKSCGKSGEKEILPIGADGKVIISSSVPTVGTDIIPCPNCGHKIKPYLENK